MTARLQHEITKLATLSAAIAEKLGIRADDEKELNEVKHHVAPDAVLDRMEAEAEPGP
jgi:hypothetical protein